MNTQVAPTSRGVTGHGIYSDPSTDLRELRFTATIGAVSAPESKPR